MAQRFYGGCLCNAGAFNDLVYRGEPYELAPMPYYGGGMNVQPARFDPSQLNVQPRSDYQQQPGYTPFQLEQDRDRFILHDPRSGVAGNPFGAEFVIPGAGPGGQPVLPGENKQSIEGVYGRRRPVPVQNNPLLPGSSPLVIRGV